MKKKKSAFTLIEVMVAVAVLAFTATAALKLVAHAELTLLRVKTKRELFIKATALEAKIKAKLEDERDRDGELSWETEKVKGKLFSESFGRLKLGEENGTKEPEELPYRKLTVTLKGDSITLPLPEKEERTMSAPVTEDYSDSEAAEADNRDESGRTSRNEQKKNSLRN